MSETGISSTLLELLRCPCPAHGSLTINGERTELVCDVCKRTFEIRDQIPVMLLDEATNEQDVGSAI